MANYFSFLDPLQTVMKQVAGVEVRFSLGSEKSPQITSCKWNLLCSWGRLCGLG